MIPADLAALVATETSPHWVRWVETQSGTVVVTVTDDRVRLGKVAGTRTGRFQLLEGLDRNSADDLGALTQLIEEL